MIAGLVFAVLELSETSLAVTVAVPRRSGNVGGHNGERSIRRVVRVLLDGIRG